MLIIFTGIWGKDSLLNNSTYKTTDNSSLLCYHKKKYDYGLSIQGCKRTNKQQSLGFKSKRKGSCKLCCCIINKALWWGRENLHGNIIVSYATNISFFCFAQIITCSLSCLPLEFSAYKSSRSHHLSMQRSAGRKKKAQFSQEDNVPPTASKLPLLIEWKFKGLCSKKKF